MNVHRSIGEEMAGHSGIGNGEVKSALAEMLRKSFSGGSTSDVYDEASATSFPPPATTPQRKGTQNHNHNPPSHSKTRSLSDSTPKLSPSPKIKENKQKARDDHTLPPSSSSLTSSAAAPRTPRRPEFLARGLSLQMPPRDSLGISATGSPTTSSFRAPPLSPRVEKRDIYASPGSVLPRHSRGLDFARACTNLHHSTLAEASPDSSPTITQKGMMIPGSRKMSMNAMAIDSPAFRHGEWHHVPSERSVFSSSMGSVKMLDSDSASGSDDELEPMDNDDTEDAIISTPQLTKRANLAATTPFSANPSWANAFSPSTQTFPNFHRVRLRNGRSRKSSSSASGHSSLASPAPQSPPPGKTNGDGGYFPGMSGVIRGPASRRESLSLHTHDLHISSGNDSGDEAVAKKAFPATPGVVRRAVTRRGNLLPKTRAFGRIRADLMEESTPIDAEVKREAEVIRQVRGSDDTSHQSTTHSSPTLDALTDALQGIPEVEESSQLELDNNTQPVSGLFGVFSRRQSSTNSGKEFWSSFSQDAVQRTPPPQSFFPRLGSSTSQSDDVSMDLPVVSTLTGSVFPWAVPSKERAPSMSMSRGSTPIPSTHSSTLNGSTPTTTNPPPTALDGIRKANKRRRDDDLDMASMKRRAVSPGVSLGNSPILSQSPRQGGGEWGNMKNGAEGRSGSNGSVSVHQTPVLGPKRVGLQGMTDMQVLTEGMSIE